MVLQVWNADCFLCFCLSFCICLSVSVCLLSSVSPSSSLPPFLSLFFFCFFFFFFFFFFSLHLPPTLPVLLLPLMDAHSLSQINSVFTFHPRFVFSFVQFSSSLFISLCLPACPLLFSAYLYPVCLYV